MLRLLLVIAAGCGRIGFDPQTHGDGRLLPDDPHGGDFFGFRVATSGDGSTIVAGAPQRAGSIGAAYVFERAGDAWPQRAVLNLPGSDSGDEQGWAVAISDDGNVIAVGAYHEASASAADHADNSAPMAGAVYVYRRGAGDWMLDAYLKASNAQMGDEFGWAVALSGDGKTLAVGATTEGSAAVGVDGDQTDNSTPVAGAAYVFSYAGAWSQVSCSHSRAPPASGSRPARSFPPTRARARASARRARSRRTVEWRWSAHLYDLPAGDAGAVYVYY